MNLPVGEVFREQVHDRHAKDYNEELDPKVAGIKHLLDRSTCKLFLLKRQECDLLPHEVNILLELRQVVLHFECQLLLE